MAQREKRRLTAQPSLKRADIVSLHINLKRHFSVCMRAFGASIHAH